MPENIPTVGPERIIDALQRSRRGLNTCYLAMYSSLLEGIVKDTALMIVPVDDHMVHRGDGVFETCKCLDGAIYNLDSHLERLENSALAVGLRWPGGLGEIRDVVVATARAGGRKDCSIRMLLSRGPGGFGVNPYESPRPALYVVAAAAGKPFMQAHPEGAKVRRSRIPSKPAFFAGVKNCNYLPNVLMKKEAVDWGADFVVGFDSEGFLGEGATENAGVVTREKILMFPRLDKVLRGTTMMRAVELAGKCVKDGLLKEVVFDDITEEGIFKASEMLLVGTTINVTAVSSYEGRPVGSGLPGPVWKRLNGALEEDIARNPDLRTEVFA